MSIKVMEANGVTFYRNDDTDFLNKYLTLDTLGFNKFIGYECLFAVDSVNELEYFCLVDRDINLIKFEETLSDMLWAIVRLRISLNKNEE